MKPVYLYSAVDGLPYSFDDIGLEWALGTIVSEIDEHLRSR